MEHIVVKALKGAAVASLLSLVVACGGGGGGGSPAGTGAQQTVIVDSFNRVVWSSDGGGDGSSGVAGGDAGADGTAGDGKPIVGGEVTITDANGRTATATTNSEGYYRVKVTGFTAPFVAKVTKDGHTRYSLNVQQVRTNGFITINLTGLTEKVASDVAVAGGARGAAELTPAIVSNNTGAISQSIQSLRSQLATVLQAAGVNADNFDPLSLAFVANHTGYDFVLDNTVITRDANGRTQVAISPTFNGGNPGTPTTPALAGNWSLTVETVVDGQSHSVPVGTFPASSVPTANSLGTMGTAFGAQTIATGYANYTVTVNGNVVTITGNNTNYTVSIDSFSASGYQGCGACGVGSQVSFTMNFTTTSHGTLDGTNIPPSTESFVTVMRYQRVN